MALIQPQPDWICWAGPRWAREDVGSTGINCTALAASIPSDQHHALALLGAREMVQEPPHPWHGCPAGPAQLAQHRLLDVW